MTTAASVCIALLVVMTMTTASGAADQEPTPGQLGPLAPDNLAKPRHPPPFDLTGTWLDRTGGSFRPRSSSRRKRRATIKLPGRR
jgi:hypothetical protein